MKSKEKSKFLIKINNLSYIKEYIYIRKNVMLILFKRKSQKKKKYLKCQPRLLCNVLYSNYV